MSASVRRPGAGDSHRSVLCGRAGLPGVALVAVGSGESAGTTARVAIAAESRTWYCGRRRTGNLTASTHIDEQRRDVSEADRCPVHRSVESEPKYSTAIAAACTGPDFISLQARDLSAASGLSAAAPPLLAAYLPRWGQNPFEDFRRRRHNHEGCGVWSQR